MKSLSVIQMENVSGGMPCGVALGLYGVSFIALAGATAGWGLVAAGITFGGSLWSVFDSCQMEYIDDENDALKVIDKEPIEY